MLSVHASIAVANYIIISSVIIDFNDSAQRIDAQRFFKSTHDHVWVGSAVTRMRVNLPTLYCIIRMRKFLSFQFPFAAVFISGYFFILL